VNDERDIGQIEELLRQAAVDLRDAYPPTPPIAWQAAHPWAS